MGLAQGIYAGWGNFGAAAAIFILPIIASFFPEEIGWRYAVGFSGILCAIWGIVYFIFAKELSEKSNTFRTGFEHNIEVTTKKDIFLQILSLIPIYGAMATLVWKLSGHPLQLLSSTNFKILTTGILILYILNVIQTVRSNLLKLDEQISPEKKYEFKQIIILSMVYALVFGSQLAVISMFPQFLESTFELSVTAAGMVGSSFAFMNLISRPAGGWISDLIEKKTYLDIVRNQFNDWLYNNESNKFLLASLVCTLISIRLLHVFTGRNWRLFFCCPAHSQRPDRNVGWFSRSIW